MKDCMKLILSSRLKLGKQTSWGHLWNLKCTMFRLQEKHMWKNGEIHRVELKHPKHMVKYHVCAYELGRAGKQRMHFKGIKFGDSPHDSCSRIQGKLTWSNDEAEEREWLGKTQNLAAVLGETYWTGPRMAHFFFPLPWTALVLPKIVYFSRIDFLNLIIVMCSLLWLMSNN